MAHFLTRSFLLLLFIAGILGDTVSSAQPIFQGDLRPYEMQTSVNGTTDSIRMISLHGDWQLKDQAETIVRVPFCYDGDQPIEAMRRFTVPSKLANYQFRLILQGVGQDASISLNGEFLALARGLDAMVVDVPPNQIHFDSENIISVEMSPDVTNPLDFPVAAGFYSPKRYSGIYRDIYLLALPQRRIESIRVKAEAASSGGKLSFDYVVRDAKPLPSYAVQSGTATTLQIRWSLQSLNGNEILTTQQTEIELPPRSISQGTIHYTVPTALSWSPVQPNLYRLYVRLYDQETLLHEVLELVGFRDLTIRNDNFYTRAGIPQRLYCATYVEEYSETGWAATAFQLERDVFAAKSLGLNALRVIGKSPHPYLMKLADRYGLWILAESPVTIPPVGLLKRDEFRQYITSSLRQVAQLSGNHPSLLAVGPGFGFPTANIEPELTELFQSIRSETKLWTYLSTPQLTSSPIADFQIFERLPGLSFEKFETNPTMGPLLFGSVGILIDPLTARGSEPTAEIRQSQSIIRTLEQENVKASSGFVLSGLCDYQTEFPLLNRSPSPIPNALPVGVITFQRNERSGYVTLRDYLNGISVKSAPTSPPGQTSSAQYIIAGLIIFTLFGLSVGQNKVLRIHITRSLLHPAGFFQDIREGRFFQFGETTLLGIMISAIGATLGAATIHGLRHDYSFDLLLTTLTTKPFIKVWLNRIIWDSTSSIGLLFLVIVVVGFIAAALLAAVSLFTRQRMSILKAISYITWGFSNHLLLLPLTLFLVGSLIEKTISTSWILVCLLFVLWSVYRCATAIVIAFRNTARIATVLFLVLLTGIGYGLWYWLLKVKMIGLFWSSFRAAGWL
ncbi:MAG: hypothetical protein OEM52_03145 [bacterium]|nr:hypothetical protein [bacterium]